MRSWVPRRPTSPCCILSVLCDYLRSLSSLRCNTGPRPLRPRMPLFPWPQLLVEVHRRHHYAKEAQGTLMPSRMPHPWACWRTRGRHEEEVEVMVPAQWTAQLHHLHETSDADRAVHDQHGPAGEPTVQRW